MATCFVLVPFREVFDQYYDEIIAPAVRDNGLTPLRGDSLFRPGPVMDDVWRMIRESSFVVAELTQQNANVFYELGLAHAAGKPVVLVSETMKDVPYDLQSLRVITYNRKRPRWGEELRQRLYDAVRETLEDPVGATPPMFRPSGPRAGQFTGPLDHDTPGYSDRAAVLYGQLVVSSFVPDLIVGVARGGLTVAYHLSKCVPNALVPVMSLWPGSNVSDGFDNPFNRIVLEPGDVGAAAVPAKVLIVDDMVQSGRTLVDAKSYLRSRVDPTAFEIKTAAISFLRDRYARPTLPDFHVDEPQGEVRDLAGDVERITPV